MSEHVHPFAGVEREPQLHRVRMAVVVHQHTKHERYVVECECGWSSSLHFTHGSANDEYTAHKYARRPDGPLDD